jgi:DNA (cytosine-5)-methyltransferase 1
VRWCMVAVTRGVEFDFDRIAPAVRVVRRVEEILEPIEPDDPRWSSFDYLHTKRERDEAKGNGFRMQFVEPSDTSVPTLRKGYHKAGSTDPLLKHPFLQGIYRKLTAAEHARVKGVPAYLVDGVSETTAHELLGQGIVYEPFRAVGERIGEAIAAAIDEGQRRLRVTDEEAAVTARERRQQATG